MKAFFDDRQSAHDPKGFIVNGVPQANPEKPERLIRLKAGAQEAGADLVAATDHGLGPIASIHSPEYLSFLQTIHARWNKVAGAGDEVIPNIHPVRHAGSYPASPSGLAGYHMADTACPIASGTWEASYWSAQSALSAADDILGGARHSYALCRPPGHHAFGDLAGGFCFLNNTAIAADYLTRAGRRVAIVDVDVHHGNGTQGIFYARSDVLTVSIHADPAGFYPFFWGHAHERGDGAGLGYNLNLPLARGATWENYRPALLRALDRVTLFGADTVAIALGLDAHENDPFRAMGITTDDFHRMAREIAQLNLPLLVVQEGGYLSDDLSANLTSFLTGLTA